MVDQEKMKALVERIAAAPLWNEDPDGEGPVGVGAEGGVTRDFQESREAEAEDWIMEARDIVGAKSS